MASDRTSLVDPDTPVDESTSEAPALLPATREPGRELLSLIEPERTLNDWGRSERIEGLMDATLYEFFYRYWFRAEVEGIENVPDDGGALWSPTTRGRYRPTRR